MNELKQILMERDGLSEIEAEDILDDLSGDSVFDSEHPEDFLFDLLEYAK